MTSASVCCRRRKFIIVNAWGRASYVYNPYLDGNEVVRLPKNMPEAKSSHCVVALEGGDLFTAGGYYSNGRASNKAHIYRKVHQVASLREERELDSHCRYETERWQEVEDMPTPRYELMCGLVMMTKDSSNGKEVIAAGGTNLDDEGKAFLVDVVEAYSMKTGAWRTGK